MQVTNTTTRAGTARAAISASQRVSKRNTLGQYGGYDVSSGLDETSRILYPLTHGPDAGLTYIHLLTRRDTLTTSAQGDLSFVPEEDERQTSLGISQGIARQFSRRTLGEAAAGVTYVRSVSPVEGVDGGVVPTGRLSLTYNAPLARGRLVLTTEAGYGPVLDRTTLVFDTRFDAAWSAMWTRDKWALYTTAGATLSVDVTQEGALRRYMGTTGASYEIGSGFVAHVGGRSLWETYEGAEVVAPTWLGFVALSWSYELFRLQLAPPPRPKPPAGRAE